MNALDRDGCIFASHIFVLHLLFALVVYTVAPGYVPLLHVTGTSQGMMYYTGPPLSRHASPRLISRLPSLA